ncbi:glutamate ABC transporter substrate-binding protein [Sanguibacter sp. HDW7]|uniref:glutamate ABC transporter substrate-binding protein n=1 Tax=Sanguibacter sp. HDW7 TaxID=2714931 RepID=UPI00140DDBE5|nr:glutamate ABC transporter substrate-binding protein [Sanguibacter sp. HDW7]QIK83280.1 glutamate ABC transporter substrate-binding protein [Sanguibacter sp. HDW7]
MRTKVIAALGSVALAATLLAGCGGDDDDKITVGIKFDQPGLGLKSGDTYSGFDVDVARYVAKELGFSAEQITFKESPSPQRENLLQSGQVDMIVATYSITDTRKEKVSFAGPYFVAGQGLLVQESNTDITGPETLNGKKLCSVQGSTPAQKIKDEFASEVQLQEFDTYSKCVEQLAAGTIDAVTTDDIILAGFAAQTQYKGKLKVVGTTFSQENYGIGLPKGSDRCQKVTDAITKMISSGEWAKALEANTGAAYTPNKDLNPPTPAACS